MSDRHRELAFVRLYPNAEFVIMSPSIAFPTARKAYGIGRVIKGCADGCVYVKWLNRRTKRRWSRELLVTVIPPGADRSHIAVLNLIIECRAKVHTADDRINSH